MVTNFVSVFSENEILKNLHSLCRDVNTKFQSSILYTKNVENNVVLDNLTYNLINSNYDKENKIKECLRKIIITEAYEIEKLFPGTGEDFISLLANFYDANNKKVKCYINEHVSQIRETNRKSKKDLEHKILGLKNKKSREVCEKILELSSFDTKIFLENTNQTNLFIKKTDKISFKLEFDNRFLINGNWKADEYKFIIIDGFIQEVSEIHHLLQIASESKEKYVIFCKGASEEVKNTILYNLQRGTINVFPICLKINEENVNVLNDVAACLDSDIVSAIKGDTISASVRRSLSKGKDIHINSNGFDLKVENKKTVKAQKKFIKTKIKRLNQSDPNYIYLVKRIKNLESDKLIVKINRKEMNQVYMEIDEFLKFLQTGKKGVVKLCLSKNKTKIYSLEELVILFRKLESTVDKINELGCAITLEQ